jgi:hypothetical protein
VVIIGGRGDAAQVVAVDGGRVEKEWLCLLMHTYVPGKRCLRGSVKEKDVDYVTLKCAINLCVFMYRWLIESHEI